MISSKKLSGINVSLWVEHKDATILKNRPVRDTESQICN